MAEAPVDCLEERPSMKYRLNIIVKYRYLGEYIEDMGGPCNFETYMKWNYVLNNPTMLQTKQDNLWKKCVRWMKIEQIDRGKGLLIDFGEVGLARIFRIMNIITNLRHTVMEEILSYTDDLHVNSYPTGGVDKAEVSKQMMEKSANQLQHQLWCFADDKGELIHYVCPQTMLSEVEGMIKTAIGPITDVENSSEALPSLDVTTTSDNVGDTATENNTGTPDNVGDTASENNTDTDSSDDESTGLEVCLIVDFQRKVNGKLQDFVRPFDLTLSPENFLKWQFICANQQEIDQRLDKIKGDFEKIVNDDGTLKISLGKQRRNPNLDELAKKIQTVFLEDTESLIINWFPTDMQIDTSVAASELDKALQKSDLWKNKDIYMCTTNSGQIRLVWDAKHQKTVDALIQATFQGCCMKLMPKSTHTKISLPVVYGQVLHQMNIVVKVECKFPGVSMTFDISHSSNQCTIELVGPDPAVGEAERWMKDNFVNVYITEKLKFTDVDNWLGQLDVSTLIRELLLSKCPSNVFWMIHKPTQMVWICASDKGNLQDTVTEVRTCLKQSHIVMKRDEMSMDAVEKMLVWIGGMEDILGRKVAVNVFTDNSGWNVCITGGREYVESLAERIKQFVNEETSVSSLVDTDDNGENAAVDIVHDA